MSDKEFFDEIYEKYEKNIYKRIKNTLYFKIEEDIISCIDDTFYKAWVNIKKLRKHENIAGWLVITAKNIVMDFNKKYSIIRNHEADSNFMELIPHEEDFTEKISGEIEAEKILARLSKKDRNLYDFKYVTGYSNEEIGKILGITPSAVSDRIQKMLKRLKEIYKSKK